MKEQDVVEIACAAIAQRDWPLVYQVTHDVRAGIGSPLAAALLDELVDLVQEYEGILSELWALIPPATPSPEFKAKVDALIEGQSALRAAGGQMTIMTMYCTNCGRERHDSLTAAAPPSSCACGNSMWSSSRTPEQALRVERDEWKIRAENAEAAVRYCESHHNATDSPDPGARVHRGSLMTDFADRPRVFVKVVTLDADGYRRGYEDEIVLEPDASYGDFMAWVDESIDRAIDDPEGRRWEHEETIALAITRYADARTASEKR